MASRRFTLAGLLLFVMFIGLLLAIAVPQWRYLERVRTLADYVADIALSADGSTAAVLTGDGTVRVWDLAAGELRATLATNGGMNGLIALSFDGELLAASSVRTGQGIEIWDIATRRPKQALLATAVTGLAFSPVQNLLAIVSGDAVILHDLDAAAANHLVVNDVSLAFSPDGQTIAIGEKDGIHFYATASLARDERSVPTENPALCMAYSPDGKTLTMREKAFTLRQIDTDDLTTRASRVIPFDVALPFELAINHFSMAYLPEGRAIAVPRGSGIAIVDAQTLESLKPGEEFSQLAAGLRGQHFIVADGTVVDLYDGQTLQKVSRLLNANPKPGVLMPVLLLAVWAFFSMKRRASRLGRRCASCGRPFQAAGTNDASSECPTCRYQARLETLTADEAAREQKVQSRQTWFMLLLLDVLLAATAGMFCRDRFGFLSTFLAVAVGLPAFVFVAMRLARKWVICLPSSLAADIAVAERAAGTPGRARQVGEVLVWSAEGTPLADEFEPQLEAARQRLAAVTGRLVSPSPKLRVFLFADGDGVLRYLRELGFRLEDQAARRGIYISAPANRLFVGERDARVQETDPCFTLRWLIARHLIEQAGVAVRRAWLIDGLAGMIAYESSEHERASLNRRALAGIATGRTLSAEEWFAGALARKRRSTGHHADLQTYAWFRQFQIQSRSLMEFVCGCGATPERRAAFQQLFNDPDLQTRPAETFEQYFGCPIDELFAQWRAWIELQGVDEHLPPPPQVAAYLTGGPLARISAADTARSDRIEAIREWGERGYAFGAEQLVALLRGDDEELRAEVIYALECVSGRSLGTTAESWEAWARRQRPEREMSNL